MQVGECLFFAWKFCNFFHIERAGIAVGMQPRYGHFSNLNKKRKKQSVINDGGAPDKTEDLIGPEAKRSRRIITTVTSNVSDGVPTSFQTAFPGIKWSFDLPHIHVINTCPLDSLLTLTYALHKCNIFTNDWPQLSDDQRILSRSFMLLDKNQCDDARLLWLKAFFGHNDIPPHLARKMGKTERKTFDIIGTCSKFFDCEELAIDGRKTINPVRDAVRVEFKQQSTCLREGGCAVPDKSVTGKVRHKKIGYLRAMSTSDDPLDLLKSMVEEHTTTGACVVEWEQNLEELSDEDPCTSFDPAEFADARYCPGPVLNSNATEICWPHTVVIEYPLQLAGKRTFPQFARASLSKRSNLP
jgi:hypothetical protein